MALHLMLLRHAKSSRAENAVADRDRPLAPSGREDAATIGQRMVAAGHVPERIVCSAALRARETLGGALAALLPALPDRADIVFSPELYESGADGYIRTIAGLGVSASPLLLIGHNPAMHECAKMLVGSARQRHDSMLAASFPTANVAVIAFDIASWHELTPGMGALLDWLSPE